MHKSAITDHMTQQNHIVDWEGHICKQRVGLENKRHQRSDMDKENQNSMYRDEGRYRLSHIYDDLLACLEMAFGGDYECNVSWGDVNLTYRRQKPKRSTQNVLHFHHFAQADLFRQTPFQIILKHPATLPLLR